MRMCKWKGYPDSLQIMCLHTLSILSIAIMWIESHATAETSQTILNRMMMKSFLMMKWYQWSDSYNNNFKMYHVFLIPQYLHDNLVFANLNLILCTTKDISYWFVFKAHTLVFLMSQLYSFCLYCVAYYMFRRTVPGFQSSLQLMRDLVINQ